MTVRLYMDKIQPLTLRLFPKNLGARAYRITGIAERCDWIVLSDTAEPHVTLYQRSTVRFPRYIFLSLRSPFAALSYFSEEILPTIRNPFVLVSGSEDATVPIQTDRRWRAFNVQEKRSLAAILEHPLLTHWYAENLSVDDHPKHSPLPTGLVDQSGSEGWMIDVPEVPRLHTRPASLLLSHRVRKGPQWDLRKSVTSIGKQNWNEFTTILEEECAEPEFEQLIQRHAFVACVEGGGLDPSPKAWQSILNGAIPIIRNSALRRAYELLPVVIVQDWEGTAITKSRLDRWLSMLMPYFDHPSLRHQVLERLDIAYWWNFISQGIPINSHNGKDVMAIHAQAGADGIVT